MKGKVYRPPWWVVWFMAWLRAVDGLVGVVSFGWVPLDLSGSLAEWAFRRLMFEKQETRHARRSPRKTNRRGRKRKSRNQRRSA